ncbi:MAG: GrpB family protein [Dehalococcoidia bacterium]|nr:GrpB family protein [Dehalococcoidia bacterium]
MTESPRRTVEVVPYHPAWPAAFEAYAAEMRDACGDLLVTVEHIGSTAVPGLDAKPVIDLMPGVANHEDARRCIEPLERLGLRYRGENGIPLRYYFNDGVPRRRNVHLFVVGESQWPAHLLFRDYLRTYADARDAYARLKHELAEQHRDDTLAYCVAKDDFVQGVIEQARAEGR